MAYSKPWLSFPDQLRQLKARGMVVTDDTTAQQYLDRIGYYRLSGYWNAFRVSDPTAPGGKGDNFVAGTLFTDALHLYIFDKKLRLLALDALERIEVAIRVDMAHLLGQRDTAAYMNRQMLDRRFSQVRRGQRRSPHDKWVDRLDKLVSRSSETFIDHFKQKYGLPLPIWVAIEVWDFGAMSMLYAGMKGKDRDTIAQKYGVPGGHILGSWLRALNYLRNLCAHHCRLWNRNMVDQPKLPSGPQLGDLNHFVGNAQWIARPFVFFSLLQWLMREICPNSHWKDRVHAHLQAFPVDSNQLRSLSEMGCPSGWERWNLWK